MITDHELILSVKFKVDTDGSTFEHAKASIIHILENEMEISLADDSIIEDDFSIKAIENGNFIEVLSKNTSLGWLFNKIDIKSNENKAK